MNSGRNVEEVFLNSGKRGETLFVCLVGHFIMVITAWHAYLIPHFLPKNTVQGKNGFIIYTVQQQVLVGANEKHNHPMFWHVFCPA